MADPGERQPDARQLQGKLENQVCFYAELVRLYSATLSISEILEKAAQKSTAVLGRTALVVLISEGRLQLETAYSADRDVLTRMLIAAWNASPHGTAGRLLHELIERGAPIKYDNLQRSPVGEEMQALIEQCGLLSLIATPIRSGGRVVGSFVSISSAPHHFEEEDLATATVVSDFIGAAIDHARLAEEMQRSVLRDSLTGVYNARFFRDTLAREVSRAHRYATQLSLLMVDIDSFKAINDTFGRLIGDKVLAQTARLIESVVRNTDFVCRTNGEAFGVILPGTTLDGAYRTAEKIFQKVRLNNILEALGCNDGPLTVSIGAAEYRQGSQFETLLAEAGQALHTSRRAS
jgi:diguanylate cyclase (GGDEF)-like protein